jgi:large repetitive protein
MSEVLSQANGSASRVPAVGPTLHRRPWAWRHTRGSVAGVCLGVLAALAPGQVNAAASVAKDFLQQITGPIGSAETAAGTVNRGDVVTMKIDVLNSANLLTGGTLTDSLPTGMVLAAVPNPRASSGCSGAITYTAVGGAATFGFASAEVPAQTAGTPGLCSVYVDVAVPLQPSTPAATTVTLNNTIASGSVPASGGFTATDSVTSATVTTTSPTTRSLSVRSLNNLTAAKSFSPSTVNMGENSTVQIVLSNPNSGVSVAVSQLSENLPGNLVATNTTPTITGAGSCTSATASASGTSGNTSITFTGLTLAPSASCTVNWVVRGIAVNGANNTTAPAANSVPANSVLNSRSLPQAATSATLTVRSPLNPGKSFSPSTAAANQPVALAVTLQNRSASQSLSAVAFSDALPAGMSLLATVVTGSAGCGGFAPFTPVGGATTLAVAGLTIAPSAICTLTASVTVNNDGSYPNTIALVDYTSDNPNVGTRQSGPASATLTAFDQITIGKAALDPRTTDGTAAGSVAVGNLVRYRLTINNYTSAIQAGLTANDPLPLSGAAQVAFLTSPAPSFSNCGSPAIDSANGAANAQFSSITIPAGSSANPQTCTIDYHVQVPAAWPVGAAIVNGTTGSPIAITQGGPNLVQGNQPNTSSSTLAPLTATKAVASGTVFQGGSTTVTVTLSNNNYVDLNNVSLLDSPLFNATGSPSQVTLATPAGPSTTCSGVPAYNAVAGSTSFQVSGLSVPQRGSCTVSFQVRGVVPGAGYVNTIPTANVSGTATINGTPSTQNPAAPATASLTVNSVLSIAKSFSPAAVSISNGVARVTLVISNLGAQGLSNVQLVDPLPASLQLAPNPNPSTSCSGPTSFTAAAGAASATLSGASVAGNGSCLFQFDVVTNGVGGAAASINTIPANNVTADNGVFNASPASATLNKLGSTTVNVTKSFSPASLTSVGQFSRLQITIDNSAGGAVALSNLALADNLPSGMVVAAVPAPSTTCTGGAVSAVPSGTSVVLSGATLAAGNTCVFEANVTLMSAGTFNNTIPAAAVSNAQGVTNTNPFTANLQALASLGVTKSFSPTAVTPGSASRLTIRLINSQALQFDALSVTDIFPSGLVAASPSAASTTCSGGTVAVASDRIVLTGGSLAAAAAGASTSCDVSLNVVASVAGGYVNTIPVGGATGTDGNGAQTQNSAPATATLNVRAVAPITKSFASPNVRVGQSDRLSIGISNAANAVALTNAVLQDNLPAGVTVAQAPNATASNCGAGAVITANAGDLLVRLTGGTIAAGGTCVIAVDVLSNTPGSYTNTIPDGALQTAEGVSNPSPAAATFSTYEPPTVGKEFTPVQIASGGVSKLRIVLGNINASALTMSAALTDTLPTGLTLGTPAIDGATADVLPRCASASGTSGSTTVTVASGVSIPAGGCVVIANVTGTALGQFTNTIPAGALQTNGGNNQNSAVAVLSISTRNSIVGKVYLDTNNDGAPGAAEPPLAAQSIVLERLDSGGTVVETFTTASNTLGNYAFLDLPDSATGSYRVRQPGQPPGTLNGITSVGTLGGGAATGPTTTPSQTSGIALNSGQNASGYNFGELLPVAIAGKVFLDQNNNGTMQSADAGIAGVPITLQGSNDQGAIAPLTTNSAADGSYSFAGLRPGSYSVTEGAQPAGTHNGLTVVGSGAATAGSATTAAQTPSAFTGVVLASGQNAVAYNFAEIPADRSIGGRLFVDLAGDNVFNGGDSGIAGLAVTLSGTNVNGQPVSLATTSGSDGRYSFTGLSAGTYAVGYNPSGSPALTTAGSAVPGSTGGSAATRFQTTGIDLTGQNTGSSNNDFTRRPPGTISGSVYVDANNNGLFEPPAGGSDAPIPGVVLTLTGVDFGPDGNEGTGDDVTLPAVGAGGAVTATTAADGSYSFSNQRSGRYNVVEPTQPTVGGNPSFNGVTSAGSVTGTPAGTPGTATPVATVPSAINGIVLAPGGTSPANNFGEISAVTVGGLVFIDANRNDALDPSDTGRIGSVTLRLVQGASCATGTTMQTTSTNVAGQYSFSNVQANADYRICQTQPVGYGNGASIGQNGSMSASNQIVVTNLPATGLANQNFGERLASLAGAVYQDFSAGTPANTDNGVRDAGEAGIANVPVTLAGSDILGNAVIRSTTTDAGGNYLFDGLIEPDAAGYTVTEGAIPVAAGVFNDARESVGNATTAPGTSTVNDVFAGVRPAAGQQATGYLFGELPIAPVSGTVYIDSNRNHLLDAADPARIAGVTIQVFPAAQCSGAPLVCTGAPLATTVTDTSGNYSVSGLSTGLNYVLVQTQPVAYANGNAGGSAGSNSITINNLAPAGSPNNHFGEFAGSVAGSVFLDANNDGARAGGDIGISGVVMTLSGTDINGNPITRTANTDPSGNFSFNDLPAAGAGGYAATQQATQPNAPATTTATLNGRTTAGTIAAVASGTATPVATRPSAVTAIALTAGAVSVNHLFAEILPVGISGVVFIDANNNGVQNAPVDTPLAGVSIVITGSDDLGSVTRSVTTAADGSYSALDLRPGTYSITEPTQPAGTANGQTVAGPAGGSATPITSLPSAISNLVLNTPGVVASANNFGEIPTSSAIAGRIWLDADNNGVIDPTETGVAGVTVELAGLDLANQPVARTTTTAADGSYSFASLPPGTYTVREPTQPAGTVNGSTVAGSTGGTATPAATQPSVIGGIAVGLNQTSSNNNFGEIPGATISGRVYGDNNNNGSIDSGEGGIAGVSVVLTGTDDLGNAVNTTGATAADGSYAFNTLRPGTYTVTEPAQPPLTVNGITSVGTINGAAVGSATPVATVPSAVASIVLPPAGQSVNNHFGEIGDSPDLLVSKLHTPATFTSNNVGTYTVTARNAGQRASTGAYTVSDRLPAGLTLAATPSGTGWSCAGAAGAGSFTCTSSTAIAAGATSTQTIEARVNVGAAAAAASPVQNLVSIDGGGEFEARRPSVAERDAFNNNPSALPVCSPAVLHNVCRDPTPVQLAASISGTAWYDIGGAPRVLDGADRRLPNWRVEIVSPTSGALIKATTTGVDGSYRVGDLIPGIPLAVRFRDPASNVVFGYPVNGETAPNSSGAMCDEASAIQGGTASSCVQRAPTTSLGVVLAPGQNLAQQSLPIDPSGVVYDATTRQPVAGSVVSLAPSGTCTGYDPNTSLVNIAAGGYTVSGSSASMTVGADGLYQFLFAPSAPASCTFTLSVAPPSGYSFVSTAITPAAGALSPPGGPGSTFAVQPQATAPTGAPGPATTYYLTVNSGSAGANIVHNHIPLDPLVPTALALTKRGDKSVAEVGDTVLYTVALRQVSGPALDQVTVRDRLPAGFTLIRGTVRVNGVAAPDPDGGLGPTLAFNLGPIALNGQITLNYRLRIGVGSQQGDGTNRAQAFGCGTPAGCVTPTLFTPIAAATPSNEGRHRVKVTGGVFTAQACVLGKIFVDCNNNHVQEPEELGIPGVRFYFEDGSFLVSDSEGKYSQCDMSPKSHVLKADALTLPRGSRLTTSSNRNLGDANSLFIDLKNGELHRADFIEGSCSNTVLEQVKARRSQGEVRAVDNEKKKGPALKFESKPRHAPAQATDSANQPIVKPRTPAPGGGIDVPRSESEKNVPVPDLPLNPPASSTPGGAHVR